MTENISEKIDNAIKDIEKIQIMFRQKYGEECLADKEIEEVLKIAKEEHEELERWHTDHINEKIKNPFAWTSTLICHNCDHKDEYIEELEAELQQYHSIGAVEECREAVGRQSGKKPNLYGDFEDGKLLCPNCEEDLMDLVDCGFSNCPYCGQRISWEEGED